jgi:L-ribulose-5-phosphate 3-epimerase
VKLSMMTYTMTRSRDFDLMKMLKLTRELEMDGIDICFLEKLGKPVKELRIILNDFGIGVVCNTFSNDINGPEMTGSRWLENLKTGLENTVILGAPTVMIPTPGIPELNRSENRKRWVCVLGKGVEIARDMGINLTVENFPGEFSPFVIADDLMEAVQQVPGLKITYDNGNAASGEDPAESFHRCADYIVHAHFKDWDISDKPEEGYRRMLDGKYYFPALIGEGDINHHACIKTMKECGYNGYINIEYEGDRYNPYEGVRRAAAYLRKLLI